MVANECTLLNAADVVDTERDTMEIIGDLEATVNDGHY